MEESNSTEPGKEEERVICPAYGEIFKDAGHKIILRTCIAQQSEATIEKVAEKEDVHISGSCRSGGRIALYRA